MPSSASLSPAPALGAATASFAADCLDGLSRARKSLPCKWLYDDAGSTWFERITALAEYYPGRAEQALLANASTHVAALSDGPASLVELGSGASRKTRAVLAAIRSIDTYVPIDISAAELDRAEVSLRADFPALNVVPLCADFTAPRALDLGGVRGPVLLFFPGSTLGNMAPQEAVAFLGALRDATGSGTRLLLGVDLLKDERTLHAAYDDADGVTAAFNLNLLHRMRRELGASVDIGGFRHRAVWNAAEQRVEMHLEAMSRQVIALLGRHFTVEAGETIHTENSYKLSAGQWQAVFTEAGWRTEADWQSPPPRFLLTLLGRKEADDDGAADRLPSSV